MQKCYIIYVALSAWTLINASEKKPLSPVRSPRCRNVTSIVKSGNILDNLLHFYCFTQNPTNPQQPFCVNIKQHGETATLTACLASNNTMMRQLLTMPQSNKPSTIAASILAAFQHSTCLEQHVSLKDETAIQIIRAPKSRGALEYDQEESVAFISSELTFPTSLVKYILQRQQAINHSNLRYQPPKS